MHPCTLPIIEYNERQPLKRRILTQGKKALELEKQEVPVSYLKMNVC